MIWRFARKELLTNLLTLRLAVALVLAFAVALLILLINPDVILSGGDWVRLALFFVLSCLFLGQIFILSLMVSSWVRHSATSLIICLSIWLVGGVGYANILPSFSRYSMEERPWQDYVDQQEDMFARYNEQMAEWSGRNPGPGEIYLEGVERDGILRYAHRLGYDYLQRQYAYATELQIERADYWRKILWHNQEPLAEESRAVDRWSILSPFTNYRTLAKYLARSTLDDLFYLARFGFEYRKTFVDYLRGKRAFSSRRWFTDDAPDQEPLIPDLESADEEALAPDSPFMKARLAWAEEQLQKLESAPRYLDLNDMPKFGGRWRRTLGESLAIMAPGLAALFLVAGIATLAAVMRFMRYDPR